MSAASVLKAAKSALFAASTTLLPDVVVTYGPAFDAAGIDDLLEIRDASFSENEARLSTQRRRWFDFTIDGRVVCSRGGGEEVQQTVTEAALDIVGAVADYLQDAGTAGSSQVTLGGVVEWARVSSSEITEEDEDIERGRTTYIDFTVSGQFVA